MRCKHLAVLLLALSCKGGSKSGSGDDRPARQVAAESRSSDSWGAGSAARPASPAPSVADKAMALDEGKMGKKDSDRHRGQYKVAGEAALRDDSPAPDSAAAPGGAGGKHAAETVTRAWFPETFLFEPLIVTDDAGNATVPVKVPDRLTTWRVLALGHSRTGAQGGATTSFLGTLPTYIDPVVPPFLIIGDEVDVPIQLVNTTAHPVTTMLAVDAKNATIRGAAGPRTIPALGSLLEHATIKADRAATIHLRAALGGADAIERTIDVEPAGRPITLARSGTLAVPRTLTIEGPAGADPATDRVRLLVFPGALALLHAELDASTSRVSVADDAYALLLAGRASDLLAKLGDKADPEALRTLAIVSGQRAIRDARTLDVDSASLLAEAALAHPQRPVLARLGERAVDYLAQQQRPDGTFAGGTGWTLQRVLVATAAGTRAVGAAKGTPAGRQRALAVATRASGAFERNFDHIEDGYTAAAIVASGGVTGELADKLRAKITAAIKAADDGTKYLDVPAGVVRADGSVPSRVEATALAVLALAGDPKAPLADLGSTLLGSYNPALGWGDGRANLACMDAVLELFKTPVPANVKITLTMDGKPIADGVLDADKLRKVLVLDAPAAGVAGKHEWKLAADPAVPGLGFSLAIHAWVPWDKEATHGGLELALSAKVDATVGKATELAIGAIAPSGLPLHIQEALPAGVQIDTPSLQALVSAGTIQRFAFADGKLDLYAAALQPGQTFSAKVRVIPTLAGKLHTAASTIEAGANEFHVPPTEWTIH